MEEKAVVPVRTSWASKINWLQVAGAVGTLLTTNALGLPAETQVKVLAGWTLIQNVGTIVLRTWFNKSVSPASLGT